MKKEMLINVSQPEECRIAIVEDGILEEFYLERTSQDNYVGNIYKGVVVNLEPSIQAAFVDFGVGKNGFLHISDVEPQYFRQGGYDPAEQLDDDFGGSYGGATAADFSDDEEEEVSDSASDDDAKADSDDDSDGDSDAGDDAPPKAPQSRGRGQRRPQQRRQRPGMRPRVKPPIQEIFKRGDEVLVQVIKEGIGSKGPTLSTYISIPGRYLVLMPALGRVGVSRKIEDDQVRRRLRSTLLELSPPKGLGFIVRTAGQERNKKELSRDMAYLLRLWKVIVRRLKNTTGPCDIYEESDMIIRTIRDIFSSDVDSIYVDSEPAYERAKEFLQLVMPRHVNRLKKYESKDPLFHKYRLDEEIARINQREVPLRRGGSIVIDQTEALVAIDVNSGNFRYDGTAEEAAYQLNMMAAKEIARQLRLRDLGGVVVNDFIDMRREKHRRNVERALRDSVKRDRARTKILKTSPFGLIEMTRQRIRPSLKRSVFKDCPCCKGRGVVKSAESMAIEVVRMLLAAAHHDGASHVTIRVNDEVATYLNNKKRRELARIEEDTNIVVQIYGSESFYPEHLEVECVDADGRRLHFDDRPTGNARH
ncbi:Rne/Rng family ribonuclease [Blastopirellula sp. J2-11]|uniref:Rne/Rng family ribonuclease n=1 Tax=Blastopirellula sp. J2-11 TaxID=2943192 RepID=UPI0021C95B52|nr:Rne/Rng family ribonuclease [Blastopirellula sp. J2-11]UUO05952.1 Rne/Rng family ribonuclease [Blastopirellula sp. J2-11]